MSTSHTEPTTAGDKYKVYSDAIHAQRSTFDTKRAALFDKMRQVDNGSEAHRALYDEQVALAAAFDVEREALDATVRTWWPD